MPAPPLGLVAGDGPSAGAALHGRASPGWPIPGGAIPDRALPERAGGAASEFAALHGALRTRLVATARRRLGDRDLAEDVAQEAFVRLLEHGGRVPVDARPKWLFRVLANLCADQRRRGHTRPRTLTDAFAPLQVAGRHGGGPSDDDLLPGPVGARPDEQAVQREACRRLREQVGSLPQQLRQALQLTMELGCDHRAAAVLLGCAVKTISTRVFRARQRLAAADRNYAALRRWVG